MRGVTAALSLLALFAAVASAVRPPALEQDLAGPLYGAENRARELLNEDLRKKCTDAFNSYGGASGISPRVPACNQDNFELMKCCEQAKSALALGPPGCLCDESVWAEVESQMTSSGIPGLTADSLKTFTTTCGIPNKGAGTC